MTNSERSREDRIAGCLLGGAVGDALGAPVEFQTWSTIRARHGAAGVTTLDRPGRFTDDTQMTLFTCEGLIRASVRGRTGGTPDTSAAVRHAYLRWLHTQGHPWADAAADLHGAGSEPDGWLVQDRRMHRREAPGTTCLSALAAGGRGTTTQPINGSKGCGGVMRAAPAGFFVPGHDTGAAYRLGCDLAAITHGHPDGWHAAGALAAIVHELAHGSVVADAVAAAQLLTSPAIRRVLGHATAVAAGGLPTPEVIEEQLGAGWVADEALAIAVCCALAADDFASGVLAAVNHSGDTDSTGAICGNLLGTHLGRASIPTEWLEALDARDLVEAMAVDVRAELDDPPSEGGQVARAWAGRYPPW